MHEQEMEKKLMERKNELLEELDGHCMQFAYLKDFINVKKDIENHNGKMKHAPNFELIVKCALIDSYMLILMRMYDKDQKAKTIPNLIRNSKSFVYNYRYVNSLFHSEYGELLKKLKEFEMEMKKDEYIKHAIKILRLRRNKIHAHNDKDYFGIRLQNDTSVLKNYHIWYLVNFTERVLNFLLSELSSENTQKPKYDGDLNNLFKNT